MLEERTTALTRQFVWSPLYVDALVLREDTGAGGVGGGEGFSEGGFEEEGFGGGIGLVERHYVQQDANWNVTALVDATQGSPTIKQVVERYVYDPFGQPTFLSPSWTTLTASAFDWSYLHQGGLPPPRLVAIDGPLVAE